MSEEIMQVLILTAVAMLIILLLARIKIQIRRMIKNEIYNNFPSIKHQVETFNTRIDFLNTKADELEHKLSELKKKSQA